MQRPRFFVNIGLLLNWNTIFIAVGKKENLISPILKKAILKFAKIDHAFYENLSLTAELK